jgi:hypothetical protein
VNFLVTKGYYFPLFENRMSVDENDAQIPSIQLDDSDRIYRLRPVDVRECDRAINSITASQLGGC